MMLRTLPILLLLLVIPVPTGVEADVSVSGLTLGPNMSMSALLQGKVRPSKHPHLVSRKVGFLDRSTATRLDAMIQCAQDPSCAGPEGPVKIHQCSRYRSHKQQRFQWLDRLKKLDWIKNPQQKLERVLKYLAMPGTSRHHWGTDVDVTFSPRECRLANRYYRTKSENQAFKAKKMDACIAQETVKSEAKCQKWMDALTNRMVAEVTRACPDEASCDEVVDRYYRRYAKSERWLRNRCQNDRNKIAPRCKERWGWLQTTEGAGARMYQWLDKNAHRFGFCQPYKGEPALRNPKQFTFGYEEERWHWSSCCAAKKYREKFNRLGAQVAPSFTEVFGTTGYGPRTRARLEKAYKDFVLPAYPQYVNNIHSDCLKCEANCP